MDMSVLTPGWELNQLNLLTCSAGAKKDVFSASDSPEPTRSPGALDPSIRNLHLHFESIPRDPDTNERARLESKAELPAMKEVPENVNSCSK